jgi:hypothetical protein
MSAGTRTAWRSVRGAVLEYEPERIAVGGGSVWVTAPSANKLIRINPRRLRVQGMIDTGIMPYAVVLHRGRGCG